MISFSLILLSMFAHIGGCLKGEKQNSKSSHSISSQESTNEKQSGSSSTPVLTTFQEKDKDLNSEISNEPLNLNNLDLNHYQIGDNEVKHIEDALALGDKCILARLSLNLSSKQITNAGVKYLAKALEKYKDKYKNLEHLSLDCNQIGDGGIIALVEALKNNKELKILSLYCNQIGDDGAIALVEALKNNKNSISLNLYRNQIRGKGAIALIKGSKLQSLNLRYNQIRDQDASALAEALKNNTKLLSLDLRDNQIKSDSAIALLESITTLTGLDLDI